MTRILMLTICLIAGALIATSGASAAGGTTCGTVGATDKAGDNATFSVKAFAVGCSRSYTGVKRYYRQTNGEQGKQLSIKGYTCGPLQNYAKGKLAFQCRSNHGVSKRYKALWVSKSK